MHKTLTPRPPHLKTERNARTSLKKTRQQHRNLIGPRYETRTLLPLPRSGKKANFSPSPSLASSPYLALTRAGRAPTSRPHQGEASSAHLARSEATLVPISPKLTSIWSLVSGLVVSGLAHERTISGLSPGLSPGLSSGLAHELPLAQQQLLEAR
eukprot:CAMPEP_0183376976 /NCGR_PEP_ID=MMETSP0164_2-20130417/121782_1 /TAXON_ID=221442 /ORGANISM="Coccolithus pelagicus ssp braarudi, Strain PLY182g" /LENGTH=154 /DNA_ID=CAMNT_0025554385 /DNA_START=52 /DNA_END=514 /DNA_ORIENTATION=+